jgi:hypothetical protein
MLHLPPCAVGVVQTALPVVELHESPGAHDTEEEPHDCPSVAKVIFEVGWHDGVASEESHMYPLTHSASSTHDWPAATSGVHVPPHVVPVEFAMRQ